MRTNPGRVAVSALTALAAAVLLLALAALPFLNPVWVAFEQDRSEAAAWTGYAPADLRAATNAILFDLVIGPPDFDVMVAGEPVLSAAERGHMRDVRGVFVAFAVVAAIAALWLVVARRLAGRGSFWAGVRRGALGLVLGLVAAGAVAVFAFEAAFDVFHRLLFSGGNWTFDPATDRLVQLFPLQFWFETSIGVGVVAVGLAVGVALVARRRGERVALEAPVPAGLAVGSPR